MDEKAFDMNYMRVWSRQVPSLESYSLIKWFDVFYFILVPIH